ncbi:PTS mannose/fructose/sorbose/N-acetylgalactosamine transporter subunit IIC [Anaerorhabdus furcosa]|uniref:PTS system, N-acetylgalactosamine-specific IIC component n=1 Tax=Anaerorhabdus furcosa TaxID=118967 RepID=A0A1T4P2M2_9FIRM|nr:PTS sugar transporter subunit IIC [Anaerorhabdus furcosa]SJZ85765.1 PTS system, N-acetylgalactosamine-specific IIC component [Anaerorhabdus furcosa]
MEFNIIQILLVGVIGFLGGIDQFSFLESLYRPIVMGPIVGAILGNFDLGLKIGASYELLMIGSMPIGGAQPPNAVLGGIMAVVFAIALNQPNFESALALAVPFGLLGQQAVNIWFTVSAPAMAKADSMAAKGDAKGIERLNIMLMLGIGCLFGILAMIGAGAGQAVGQTLSEAVPAWVWAGLGAAGGMMRFVGFAVLMKVMISGEFWTILIAGFASATLIDKAMGTGAYTLVIVAILGGALAYYDFQINTKIKANAGSAKEDYSDGI